MRWTSRQQLENRKYVWPNPVVACNLHTRYLHQTATTNFCLLLLNSFVFCLLTVDSLAFVAIYDFIFVYVTQNASSSSVVAVINNTERYIYPLRVNRV